MEKRLSLGIQCWVTVLCTAIGLGHIKGCVDLSTRNFLTLGKLKDLQIRQSP